MNEILLQIDSTSVTNVSFFKDYAEYIVGIPAFIISTFVAYWIYKKQVNRKELSYSIKNAIQIIDIKSTFKNRFEILFDNKKVDDLSLLIVEFINSGNQTIKKNDFEGNIKLELQQSINQNIYVLSSDITEKIPENISNNLSGAETSYEITPCLLNPKDRFKVQFLVDFEYPNDISVDVKARIAGIKELKTIKDRDSTINQKNNLYYRAIIFIIAIIMSVLSASTLFVPLYESIKALFGN